MSVMQPIIERIKRAGLADDNQLVGCSDEEIAKLEAACGLRLPRAYAEYLGAMGRRAGEFLIGSDVRYGVLLELRDAARELLAENSSAYVLPDDAFVCMMHQGYQFYFFRTGEGNDPPVYWYAEHIHKDGQPRKACDSFTGFLLQQLADYEGAAARLRPPL